MDSANTYNLERQGEQNLKERKRERYIYREREREREENQQP